MSARRDRAIRRALFGDRSTRVRGYVEIGAGGSVRQKVGGKWIVGRVTGQIVDPMRSEYRKAKRERG